jgi:hypothetical protein
VGRPVAGLTVFLVAAAAVGAGALGAQERPQPRPRPRPEERIEAGEVGRGAAESQSRHQLAKAAARVREAWLAHDPAGIVAGSPQLVIQLPGADPSAALAARQAAALLAAFFATAREVELTVRGTQEVEPGQGHVEMLRRYRVSGTQDIRAHTLFLGYRRGQQGWVLVELRAIEP